MTDVLVKHPRFSIYGEIHNQIDNDIYKHIFSTFEKDEIVMCEHSTYKPFLEMEQIAFGAFDFRFGPLLKKMKGSEWIYIKQISMNKPVICVDVRVENGFPLSVEEIEFANTGLSNPISCLSFIKNVLATAIEHKEVYKKYPEAKEMYEMLTQQVMSSYKKIRDFYQEKIEETEAIQEFEKMTTTLRRLSGLLVDIYIVDQLSSHMDMENDNGPHISIFVGARHAVTLSRLLSKYHPTTEISERCQCLL